MNDQSAAPPVASILNRCAASMLWGLVLITGTYLWWKSTHADEPASPTASGDRQPVELRPTIDGQRVDITPENAEVITHIPLPDFELVNQFGEPVTLESLKGREWVASFIFSRCAGACPILMRQIHDLRLELGDTDVQFVTFTVDPKIDTPTRLKDYGEIYGADDPTWLLVTGDEEELYRLIRNGFEVLAEENYGADRVPGFEFAHSVGLVHVDAEGRMLGHYESTDQQAVLTLRRVLTGRIETPDEYLVKRVVIRDPVTSEDASSRASGEAGAGRDAEDELRGLLPGWLARMPLVNALLNLLATLLLLGGFAAIRSGKKDLHRQLMLTAFAVSIAFLACYLTYHFGRHHYTGSASAVFPGEGAIRVVYLSILVTHVVLAVIVPVMAITTIVLGLRERWVTHRRWARVTFPIWLYVSVTGVVIYLMNAAYGAYAA